MEKGTLKAEVLVVTGTIEYRSKKQLLDSLIEHVHNIRVLFSFHLLYILSDMFLYTSTYVHARVYMLAR